MPRVEELFEARRAPKGEAVVTTIGGVANIIQSDRYSEQRTVRVEQSEIVSDEYTIPEDWKISVKEEQTLSVGDEIASLGEAQVTAQHTGQVRIDGQKVIVSYEQRESEEYEIPTTARLLIRD